MSSAQGRLTEEQIEQGRGSEKGSEGRVTRDIQQGAPQMVREPLVWAAGGSIVLSLTMRMMGRTEDAIFVGHWATTFLCLGIYNKLSAQESQSQQQGRSQHQSQSPYYSSQSE